MAHNSRQDQPLPARTIVLITLVVALLVSLAVLTFIYNQVLLLVITGIFVGIAIKPLLDWLAKRGIPHEIGALLTLLLILTVIGLFLAYLLPVVIQQTASVSEFIQQIYISVRTWLLNFPSGLVNLLARSLPESYTLLPVTPPKPDLPPAGALTEAWSGLQRVGVGLLSVAFVFFLAVNWAIEHDRLLLGLLVLVDPGRRPTLRELVERVEERVGRYLLGQGILCLVVGGLALIAYLLIGLPSAIALALLFGIMEAIPMIGPTLGAIPAVLLAIPMGSTTVILTIAAALAIQGLENTLLVPRIMGRSVGVRPLVTLLSLLVFSSLFGIMGALLAIPVAAVGFELFDVFANRPKHAEAVGESRGELARLRYEIHDLIQDIRSTFRRKETQTTSEQDHLEDTLEVIASDLDNLLHAQDQPEEVL